MFKFLVFCTSRSDTCYFPCADFTWRLSQQSDLVGRARPRPLHQPNGERPDFRSRSIGEDSLVLVPSARWNNVGRQAMRELGPIARGGFGRVVKVQLADGTVAAKKIFSPLTEDPTVDHQKLKERFRREVRVQSGLPSHLFIPVIDADLAAEVPWFLMPLAEMNYWIKIKAISKERTTATANAGLADILNSLEELHRFEIVHRDLKPENILLHDGVWKLSDFGLALPPESSSLRLTTTDSCWLTEKYCAPEQLTNFKRVTPAADIYSFGCILHDLFGTEPRIPYARQTAPGPIGVIIEKCTEVKPEKRFKSIGALRDALFSLNVKSPDPSTRQASDFIGRIKLKTAWQVSELEDLVRYLETHSVEGDPGAVLAALDLSSIRLITENSLETWKPLALSFCVWVGVEEFEFDFCDVLVDRLREFWQKGDLECRAAVALAAAAMATHHHRFFAMRFVMSLCGPTIAEVLAERIAIEIRAADAQDHFKYCADNLPRPYSEYHSAIAKLLE